MKQTLKLTGKALLASLLLTGGIANATSGDDEIYKNMTLEERLYLFDGYGSKWGFDAGSDGLWFVAERPIGDTYTAAFKLRNDATANALVIGNVDNDDDNTTVNPAAGFVGIGTDTPTTKVHAVVEKDSDEQIVTELVALSVNNTNTAGYSDTGFKLENVKEAVQWTFRTLEKDNKVPGITNSFAISKKNSGGKEMILTGVDSEGGNQLVLANGAKCINGVWQNKSSRASKENIKALSSQDALAAFNELQPMTYNYKTDKTESYAGFIAEDVPELVAVNDRDGLSAMDITAVLTSVLAETRAELKAAQEKIGELEEKVSRNLK